MKYRDLLSHAEVTDIVGGQRLISNSRSMYSDGIHADTFLLQFAPCVLTYKPL